jgi:hypothetical protein
MISYFRIPPDTEMYRAMADFMKEANECRQGAKEWAKKFNGDGAIESYASAWGSIHGIGFKSEQEIPKGWKIKSKSRGYTFARPNGRTKEGKALNAEMQALPNKSILLLNDIFIFHEDARIFYPGFHYDKEKEVLIIQTHTKNVQYWSNRPDSATELTASQYLQLIKTED